MLVRDFEEWVFYRSGGQQERAGPQYYSQTQVPRIRIIGVEAEVRILVLVSLLEHGILERITLA